MSQALPLLAALAALGLLAFAAAPAFAQSVQNQGDYPAQDLGDGGSTTIDTSDAAGTITVSQALPNLPSSQLPQDPNQRSRNIEAFLSAIARAEGTDKGADPYRVCFGYKYTIKDLRDHPTVTGEWMGEKLSDAHCNGAGLGPGCVSTAAGRYQMLKRTWLGLKSQLKLPDFSAASQDAACIELIRQQGALSLVEQGKFIEAVAKVRKVWASLPGAGYGQGERSLAWLQAAYTQAGGTLA